MAATAAELKLPPRPEFSPADIHGNLEEAMQLRCIGTGQPVKASWLCRETLEIFRRHRMPPDVDLVETLRVLTLCYTDDIKRGNLANLAPAADAMNELGALGGIPDRGSVHRRCQREPGWSPAGTLSAFKVRPPAGADAEPGVARSPRMRFPLARLPAGTAPGADGFVDAASVRGAEVLVDAGVRRQARFECLYLEGLVCMSQAYRIERSGAGAAGALLHQELPFLVEGAWWMHMAGHVAREVPRDPEESWRRARAKSSMLIRRIETGKHFEMASLEALESIE